MLAFSNASARILFSLSAVSPVVEPHSADMGSRTVPGEGEAVGKSRSFIFLSNKESTMELTSNDKQLSDGGLQHEVVVSCGLPEWEAQGTGVPGQAYVAWPGRLWSIKTNEGRVSG